ncbi:MAG: cysteine desulfurase [Salibacteraceae bacterium]|nr:cysteine desulfurase [Salibacteraceae bacterium]MDP4763270.1 cysteine desulfurase [Salibacteraceae bacterium]MDP4843152.1 cysteine desulfurase [Salibacteraceae bacterium]
MDIQNIRAQFPILNQEVNGKPLIYFDNGASSQKPQAVIDALVNYYSKDHANVHRGVHTLSQRATDKFEAVRKKTQAFVNAAHDHEIIFTRGTTEAINLVASSFKIFMEEGDEVLISAMEHHSNIVPWQMMCEETGAVLKVIPLDEKGQIIMERFDELLTGKTKMVAINHVSNTLGTINPIEEIIYKAHKVAAAVLIDGAQSCPHMKIDVQDLDADFYCFSSHKMYGPTGIGVLYGKEEWLNDMPPYQGGGEMIDTCTFEDTTFNELPFKFEAGTPNIADTIAFGAAIDWMNEIGIENIGAWEHELLEYATEKLSEIEGIRFIGQAEKKASLVSFLVGDIHPYDLGTLLDQLGIAVRTGHHCTQPLMDYYQIPGTVRASFAVYNTKEEIDQFVAAVKRAALMLG